MVLGIRGLPGVQGGVETHAEHLYPRLAALGCEVEAVVRTPFVPADVREVSGIRITRLWSPRRAGAEAFLHSLLGVLYAGWRRPDILHIHAIGPAIVTPLARLLGLRVVVTHHGPDYDRDKWGRFARAVLRAGERFGMRFSQGRIAISEVIRALVRRNYGRDCALIPNGVDAQPPDADTDRLETLGIRPGGYVLQVSRLVPEKRQLDLIRAFAAARRHDLQLVLVGGISDDDYSRQVAALAASVPGVILAGFQKGRALAQLYSHAALFVLPSSHEGLPIAVLEALSFGTPVVASDIPANLEIGLGPEWYFPLGDTTALATALERGLRAATDPATRAARRRWVTERYDWDDVATRTLQVYREAARAK
jgi:glycosyltransferase involved in cell wall biosynthesis